LRNFETQNRRIRSGLLATSIVLLNAILVVFVVLIIFSVNSPQSVFALTSNTLSFQGKIVRNDSGSEGINVSSSETSCIVSGADSCQFKASYYDDSSGTTLLGSETFSNVELGDNEGVFNLVFGSQSFTSGAVSSFEEIFSEGYDDVYVKVEFAPDGNGSSFSEDFGFMGMRAAPYALTSKYLEGLGKDNFVQLGLNLAQVDSSANTSIFINNTGGGNLLNLQNGGSSALFVGSNGRIGIGTDNPNAMLDINSGANASTVYLTTERNTAGDGLGGYYLRGADSLGDLTVYSGVIGYIIDPTNGSEDGSLSFSTIGNGSLTRKMTIDEIGNVGIGIISPNYKLQVNGSIVSSTDSTDNLGNSSIYWSNSYVNRTYLNATAYIDGTTAGDLTVTGNIIPSIDDTYTLGSATNRWKDMYLGGDSLHIGTSTTDEGIFSYDTINNILEISTDSTSNGDISFFGDDLYLDKSSGRIAIGGNTPLTLLDVDGVITATGGTSTNWNTAYGWGDHSVQGYITDDTSVLKSHLVNSGTLPFEWALSEGGTGANLIDPDDDRIMFWDDSSSSVTWLGLGDNISISGNILTVSNSGSEASTFAVGQSSDQAVADKTYVSLTFDSEEVDNGDNFASNSYTVPEDGQYQFNLSVTLKGMDDGKEMWAALYKNGSWYQWSGAFSGVTDRYVSATINVVLDCVEGDVITGKTYHDSGGGVSTNAGYTKFSGFKISEGGKFVNGTDTNDAVYMSGNVGIGSTSPSYRLELPNTASAAGQGRANSWVTYSDSRVKTNQHEIEYGLNEILKAIFTTVVNLI